MKEKPRKEDFGIGQYNETEVSRERDTIHSRITPKEPNKKFVAAIIVFTFFLVLEISFDDSLYDQFTNEPFVTLMVIGFFYLFALFLAEILSEYSHGLPLISKSVPVVTQEDVDRLSQLDEILNQFKKYNWAMEAYEEARTNRKYFETATHENFWSHLKGKDLEMVVANFFSKLGWQVKFTPTVGDGGVDLIMLKSNQKVLVQCKGLKGKTGVSVVRDAAGVNSLKKPSQFIVISPNGFTSGSIEFAKKSKITLMDWKSLSNLAKEYIQKLNLQNSSVDGNRFQTAVSKCASCNQKLNIPIGKRGKVTCPKCRSSWQI